MKLPSVTQVLSPFADFSCVSPDVLKVAAERGTKVHQACGAFAQGLWVTELDEACFGYFSSFKRWFISVVKKVIAVEFEAVFTSMGYVGHPDLLCVFRGDDIPTLVDIKTPITISPTWALQLAAYKYACLYSGYIVGKIGTLRLSKTGGNAKFDEFTDCHRAFRAFCGALSAYKYMKEVK
ncbi:hypothetical protein KKE60_06695 [Patescibacteria group bacterium]|nr:hypothetical protein [Patescibacteria group bacterium]